ncbi:unnamed protein product [Eruca vesicaria subsp. sativa]|uniref:NB-ARC domain-containing protein n=1 Tax=Eruca vesicaria subsp. sativa TaxID=29727 RepID=A0ABC8JLF8_ERUVS|nr:unnamed protein product [Eruca vesicaria subsp. sativa]
MAEIPGDWESDIEYSLLRQDTKDKAMRDQIVQVVHREGPQRVLLVGKSGIGKTRLAKMVSEHETYCGHCETIWLHLNNKFDDELSLYENIAFQIGASNRDENKPEDILEDLKEKIITALSRTKATAAEKLTKKFAKAAMEPSYLLLILDDEGNKTSENKVMEDFGLYKYLRDHFDGNLKVLITRRKDDEIKSEGITEEQQEARSDDQTEPHTALDTERFHTTDMSKTLLKTLDMFHLRDLFHSLLKDKTKTLLETLHWKIDETLVQKSTSLPAAIVVLAKSLNCIVHQKTFTSLSPKQVQAFKDVLSRNEAASGYNPILQLAYRLLETDGTLKDAVVDCFWHSMDFFNHCSCIHYGELITQWILEGYFDPVRSVSKAYNDGHAILVELINRGILKTQEGDMVVPEIAMNNLIDLRHHGLLGRSRLRFSRVYGGDKNKGLGKTRHIDDMIKTARGENIRTILVSGNRLRLETPEEFFEQPHMKDLEVVGLFDPTMEYLIQSLRKLKQLRVLVIRDYDLLPSIEELKDLRKLEVLEVSGASSVETISDDFFEAVPQLQSLNLSGLRIKNSPSSISQLKHLHSLILRNCTELEDLPDMQELEKLEVVDFRGAHNLKTCFGTRFDARRNQTFTSLRQLQLLDFSESKIKRIPMFHYTAVVGKLHSLTRLYLQNCSSLVKLPNLKPLSGLQILDLSGTTSLVDIAAVCFEQKEELKVLNLSGTNLTELPPTISELSNLTRLLLQKSYNLEAIPNIERLTSLEVFDVSGCTKLYTINGSFKDMSYLREVNLSGTRIDAIPELPQESSIWCSKLLVLADSRRFEDYDSWGQVKKAIKYEMSESLTSCVIVDRIQEFSRNASEIVEKKQVNEPWAFDCLGKKGHIYRDVYTYTIPFVDSKNHQEILEIHGSNGVHQDEETLAKSEFVAFVDNSASSISSMFNDLISVKGCWVGMCMDMKILFSGVDVERLRHLETLSLTNLPWLDSVPSNIFKNLKKLSLDCCPSIITLFHASKPHTSFLEVLKIKFCDKLEKVFEEEVELPDLHTLCLF